jgi:hypothetical protein
VNAARRPLVDEVETHAAEAPLLLLLGRHKGSRNVNAPVKCSREIVGTRG